MYVHGNLVTSVWILLQVPAPASLPLYFFKLSKSAYMQGFVKVDCMLFYVHDNVSFDHNDTPPILQSKPTTKEENTNLTVNDP